MMASNCQTPSTIYTTAFASMMASCSWTPSTGTTTLIEMVDPPNMKKVTNMVASTFPRFLQLPVELRIMVYERITPITNQRAFRVSSIGYERNEPLLVLTRQSLCTSILSTCKLVRREAEPYMTKSMAMLKHQPIRIECTIEDLDKLNRRSRKINLTRKPSRPDMIEAFTSLCRDLWSRSSQVVHQYPDRHLEIALTKPLNYKTPSHMMHAIWLDLWLDAHLHGISCAVYHKGDLEPMPWGFGGQTTGISFWHGRRDDGVFFSARRGLTIAEGADLDKIVEVVEMDEQDWDRMVEDWRDGVKGQLQHEHEESEVNLVCHVERGPLHVQNNRPTIVWS